MDDSYADAHRDRIYEGLESEIKEKAPAFCGCWTKLKLGPGSAKSTVSFPSLKVSSLIACGPISHSRLLSETLGIATGFVFNCGTAMHLVCGGGTDFRQLIKASHQIPNQRSGNEYASWVSPAVGGLACAILRSDA